MKSNVNEYYQELIEGIAENAKGLIDDGSFEKENDAIWEAINEDLIYGIDQAYVLANAFCRGYIDWGKEIEWNDIFEMLYEDISDELEHLKAD